MADIKNEILQIFARHEVVASGRLHKSVVVDAIKAMNADMEDVRNAWHDLIREGAIEQLGEELELTRKGAYLLYEKSRV